MPIRVRWPQVVCFLLFAWMPMAGLAQVSTSKNQAAPKAASSKANGNKDAAARKAPIPGSEYSGMYGFLREGEFVQVTVEENGRVSGFVSRYGDSESDRGDFLDHFFKAGKLEGNQLTFTTDVVHGVSYAFKGSIEHGGGKVSGEEGYYVLKGTLTENAADETNKSSAKSREVALKSFPQDVSPADATR